MSAQVLEQAAFALVAGQVVAIPTDTVYGLAVDPERQGATEVLFVLKHRSRALQLPVLVSGANQAEALVDDGLPIVARRIAESFWPGAVTLVLRRRAGVYWDLGGEETTIGLRCPAHPVARALCERVGPLATTSANIHGEPPLATAEELRRCFGDTVAMVIDGGRLTGEPSTVVDVTGSELRCLREGVVPFGDLEDLSR